MTAFDPEKKELLAGRHRLLLGAILLAGMLLRLVALDKQSLWLDEMTSIQVTLAPLADIVRGRVFDNHSPPLYYVLLKLWSRLVPLNETGLRLFSALTDCGNMLLLWALCRQLFRPGRSLLIVAAYGLSPFMIYYAQEGRMYALLVFIALAYTLGFVRMLSGRGPYLPRILLSGILLALGVYTHYYFAFFAIGVNAVGIVAARKSGRMVAAIVASGLFGLILFSPWFPVVSRLGSSGGQSFREFNLLVLPYALFRFVFGYAVFPLNMGTKERMVREIAAHLPYLLLAFSTVAVILGKSVGQAGRRLRFVPLLVITATPAAFGFLLSLKTPMLSERYLTVVFPFFLMLLFCALPFRNRSDIALAGLFFSLLVMGDVFYYFSPEYGKAQWEEVARYISRVESPGTAVIVKPTFCYPILEYYIRREQSSVSLLRMKPPELESDDVGERLSSFRKVVVVVSGRSKEGNFEKQMSRRGRKLAEEKFRMETGIVCTVWQVP